MGKSDPILGSIYRTFEPKGKVAILGATKNAFWECDADLYDLQLGNWDINSAWDLGAKYDTIICTRCAYFAKDPKQFMERIALHLYGGGRFFVDWGLGDHWRFEDYKVGWVKNGEKEWAYDEGNYLWSTLWDDLLLDNSDLQKFVEAAHKIDPHYTLETIKQHIEDEVPSILKLEDFEYLFDQLQYSTAMLWPKAPQFYMFVEGVKA